MGVLDEVLSANEEYAASFGAKSELALPPARRFAILTCMDARLDPAKYAGLSEGDAHVIRNAGGRASDDAIRSLVISYKLLGTQEWFVIHHTELRHGVLRRRTDAGDPRAEPRDRGARRRRVPRRRQRPGLDRGAVHRLAHDLRPRSCVVEDVTRIRAHPLVPARIPIYGYVYDVKTGRLVEVPDATAAGRVA